MYTAASEAAFSLYASSGPFQVLLFLIAATFDIFKPLFTISCTFWLLDENVAGRFTFRLLITVRRWIGFVIPTPASIRLSVITGYRLITSDFPAESKSLRKYPFGPGNCNRLHC
jgi:hypothetical protein